MIASRDWRGAASRAAAEMGLGAARPLGDALRMANDGTIEDAPTLNALYRYSGLARG